MFIRPSTKTHEELRQKYIASLNDLVESKAPLNELIMRSAFQGPFTDAGVAEFINNASDTQIALDTRIGVTGAAINARVDAITPTNGARAVGQGELVFNVKDAPFNAIGDGVTDDIIAINATVAAAQVNGGQVYFPPGNYRITSTILCAALTNVTFKGCGPRVSVIQRKTNTFSMFTFTGSNQHIVLEDLGVHYGTLGGHLFENQGTHQNLTMQRVRCVAHKNYSVWFQTGTAQCHNSRWRDFEWIHGLPADIRTAPTFSVTGNASFFNNNIIESGIITYSDVPTIRLECISAGTYFYNNKISNVIGEITNGGILDLHTVAYTIIDNVSVQDMTTVSTDNMMSLGKGSGGLSSKGNVFRSSGRLGSSLGGGLYDLNIPASEANHTVIISPVVNGAANNSQYHFHQNSVTIIGYDANLSLSGVINTTILDDPNRVADWTLPTSKKRQNITRRTTLNATLAPLVSGREFLVGIELIAGDVVSSIEFISGTTAAVTPTNQWFTIRDSARNKLGITADDTVTAWAASSKKLLALTAPFTVLVTGFYYFGICVVAATPPTLTGIVLMFADSNDPPIMCGFADAGLTTPATAPATSIALTATANMPKCSMT